MEPSVVHDLSSGTMASPGNVVKPGPLILQAIVLGIQQTQKYERDALHSFRP